MFFTRTLRMSGGSALPPKHGGEVPFVARARRGGVPDPPMKGPLQPPTITNARNRNMAVGGALFIFATGVYAYTFIAIGQEDFELDSLPANQDPTQQKRTIG
eukprot:Clim_evm4s139 gene=Clim_evmTU4s139